MTDADDEDRLALDVLLERLSKLRGRCCAWYVVTVLCVCGKMKEQDGE